MPLNTRIKLIFHTYISGDMVKGVWIWVYCFILTRIVFAVNDERINLDKFSKDRIGTVANYRRVSLNPHLPWYWITSDELRSMAYESFMLNTKNRILKMQWTLLSNSMLNSVPINSTFIRAKFACACCLQRQWNDIACRITMQWWQHRHRRGINSG